MSKKPSFERPIINMKKYKDFKVAISQVPPMDMAFKEMAINDYELLVATIYKLNELVGATNKYTEKIDEVLEWLVNEGLFETTTEIVNALLDDGQLLLDVDYNKYTETLSFVFGRGDLNG